MKNLFILLLVISSELLAKSGLYLSKGNTGAKKEFRFEDGQSELLSEKPIIDINQFEKVVVGEYNRHNDGSYKVWLEFSKNGQKKFGDYFESRRDHSICLVIESIIIRCLGLPPPQKGLNLRGFSILVKDQKQAKFWIDKLNTLIGNAIKIR